MHELTPGRWHHPGSLGTPSVILVAKQLTFCSLRSYSAIHTSLVFTKLKFMQFYSRFSKILSKIKGACVRAQARTHTHTHTYIYIYKLMYKCIYSYIHTYIHICIHNTHIHTYIHTYIHKYIRTYVHTYIHRCIHTLYIHTHSLKKQLDAYFIFSIFRQTPLHVSGVSIAHHQEIYRMDATVGTYCSF